MARNYYSGVPIGGTIMWAGSLIGLEIPVNFTENYKLSAYVDIRKSPFILASSLPSSEGYYLRGYNDVNYTSPLQYAADNTLSLPLNSMPKITLSHSNSTFPTFKYSYSDLRSMFTIGNNTTTSVLSNNTTQSSSARNTSDETDYSTRYAPYDDNSFDWDYSSYLSGTGSGKYPCRSSGSSTKQSGSHSHSTSTDTHSHSLSLSFSPTFEVPEDIMFNTATQESVNYTVQTKSVGIQLITRMY